VASYTTGSRRYRLPCGTWLHRFTVQCGVLTDNLHLNVESDARTDVQQALGEILTGVCRCLNVKTFAKWGFLNREGGPKQRYTVLWMMFIVFSYLFSSAYVFYLLSRTVTVRRPVTLLSRRPVYPPFTSPCLPSFHVALLSRRMPVLHALR
jgi:hypothetical protein